MCAGRADGSVDSCHGDSGVPVIVTPPERPPLLVGIVSFGQGCGDPDFPGICAQVARYAILLQAMIAAARMPKGDYSVAFKG